MTSKANFGRMEATETTEGTGATNADPLLTDSLDLTKEQLMRTIVPSSPHSQHSPTTESPNPGTPAKVVL